MRLSKSWKHHDFLLDLMCKYSNTEISLVPQGK